MLLLHGLSKSFFSPLNLKTCISYETNCFVPPTPVSHALPQLCRTPNMGSQRVLPGPCSGKQDTSEHTWAEVKTNWLPLPGRSKPGREGQLGSVCESGEQRELPQDLFSLSSAPAGALSPSSSPCSAQTGELKSSSVGWLGIPLASSDPDSCSSQVWGSVWHWNSFNAA